MCIHKWVHGELYSSKEMALHPPTDGIFGILRAHWLTTIYHQHREQCVLNQYITVATKDLSSE